MYASSVNFLNLDRGLINPRKPFCAVSVSPKLTSCSNLCKSPRRTLLLTTPSLNSSLYSSLAIRAPGICNALYASLKAAAIFSGPINPGIKPLAPAKAPADTKLRTCVTGLKIVFAICDVAFG